MLKALWLGTACSDSLLFVFKNFSAVLLSVSFVLEDDMSTGTDLVWPVNGHDLGAERTYHAKLFRGKEIPIKKIDMII